jgi:hypothetical protein
MKSTIVSAVVAIGLLAVGAIIETATDRRLLIAPAEAIVGRPLTPVSYAGVARRTTRRMIYRTSVYVAVLPPSCTIVVIEGSSLHYCGGTYYQPHGTQYVVVNVQ